MQEHYIDHNKAAHIMNTTNILRISTHTIAICMTNGRRTKTRGPKTSGAYTSTDHAKLASQLAKLFTHQSLEPVNSDQGGEELRVGAVEKLILTLWKL